MNSVSLIGNLAADPEVRTTGSGKKVGRLRVAVSRMGSDTADFVTVVVWEKQAENCAKFLSKGSKVGVSGRLQSGSYEKDGVKRSTLEVVASQVEFLSTKKSSGGSGSDDDYVWDE